MFDDPDFTSLPLISLLNSSPVEWSPYLVFQVFTIDLQLFWSHPLLNILPYSSHTGLPTYCPSVSLCKPLPCSLCTCSYCLGCTFSKSYMDHSFTYPRWLFKSYLIKEIFPDHYTNIILCFIFLHSIYHFLTDILWLLLYCFPSSTTMEVLWEPWTYCFWFVTTIYTASRILPAM